MKSDPFPIDIRIQQFLWLYPFGALFHASLWISRRGFTEYPIELENHMWTPGMFMSVGSNLLINWLLWLLLAFYLPWSAHRGGRCTRPAAAAFAVISALHFFHLYHRVPNHFLLILIPAVLLAVCRSGGRPGTPDLVLLLRSLVTLTYLFAAVHKFTPFYFSPLSPAIPLFRTLLANLGLEFGNNVLIGSAAMGVAMELAIPICLVSRKLRAIGFYLGIAFHGFIAGTGAADYSIVICALYPVFLDKDEAEKVLGLLRRFRWVDVLVASLIALAFTYFCFFPLDWTGFERSNNGQTGRAFVPVLVVIFLYAYAAMALLPWLFGDSERDPRREVTEVRSSSTKLALASFALLYSLNCLAPFVGFKYYFSQTMFSGLNQSATNHYFLPRIRLFDNDRYLWVDDFRIDGEIPQQHAVKVVRFRHQVEKFRLIQENYFVSFLENACAEPAIRGIGFTYGLRGQEAGRAVENACTEETDLRGSYPFNLFKRHPRVQ